MTNTTPSDASTAAPESRSKRLKANTHAAHDRLDSRIMAADPFGSRASYVNFLRVQHAFHQDIDALYDNAQLDKLLPDLAGRRRLSAIEGDLTDLDGQSDLGAATPAFQPAAPHDLATALGWLYVAEGSNMGAAFLLKAAKKIELSETFGARHLAGAPEGRGLHWRTFTAALDTIALSPDEEDKVVAGATAAFTRVRQLVELALPLPPERDVA